MIYVFINLIIVIHIMIINLCNSYFYTCKSDFI